MPAYDYDLFVIGAGSGGVRAARVSATHGARVAIAENRALGGTCVNVGCVPKKLFVYGSHFAEDFEDAAAYGWRLQQQPAFDWPTLRDNKTREIERLNSIYQGLLDAAGVRVMRGTAHVRDPHTVVLDGRRYSARYILIATGSHPYIPPGLESGLGITSDDVFFLERFPRRVVIVGGGYIAVEFAGIFQGLGAQTTLLYRGPLFLRGFDDSVREFVAEEIRKKGVDLRFNTEVLSVDQGARERLDITTDDGHRLVADELLYATGRIPNTAGLGLEGAGVHLSPRGAVEVDDFYQSSVPSIYALGDVIDRMQLTPVAIAEAMCFADNLFRGGKRTLDYASIPTAVFCQPCIGTVGLSEAEARLSYPSIRVFESTFKPMKHTLTGRNERTLMKLIVNADDDRVVGAHMVGADAGEIVQGLGVALKCGATKSDFDATVGIHPTAAEEFVTMRDAVR
jgi:glutathione reductase (NADPH)